LQTTRGLDDYSRYIVGWKLCTSMRAEDVTATFELALAASGCGRGQVWPRGAVFRSARSRSRWARIPNPWISSMLGGCRCRGCARGTTGAVGS